MLYPQGSAPRPEEELDRLTKKLVYDMNHPPTEEYFGMETRALKTESFVDFINFKH